MLKPMLKFVKINIQTMLTTCGVFLLSQGTPVFAENWSGRLTSMSIGSQTRQMVGGTPNTIPPSGLHFGYDLDLGQIVLGGEVEVEAPHGQDENVEPPEMQRLRLRAGYDFGQTLGYLSVGGVRAETEHQDETGAVVGIGLTYSLNQNVRLGGEVLYQDISGLDQAGLRRGNSFSLRASFRF